MRADAESRVLTRDFEGALRAQDRRRQERGDRRDQEGQPEQGRAARRLHPGRHRAELRRGRRRACLSVLTDRQFFQGQRRLPEAGARLLRPAGAAQGLHRRRLPDLRIAGDGRRLRPADRRLPGRRADGRARGHRPQPGHGGAGRGARRRRARARAQAQDAACWASTTATCAPSRCRWRPPSTCWARCRPIACWSPSRASRRADDVKKMRDAGVHAFLVGEAFMRADDPGEALAALFAMTLRTWISLRSAGSPSRTGAWSRPGWQAALRRRLPVEHRRPAAGLVHPRAAGGRRHHLPAAAVARAGADAPARGARRDPGPGPVPRPRPGRRAGVLGAPGVSCRRRCATSSRNCERDLGTPPPPVRTGGSLVDGRGTACCCSTPA